MIPLPLGWTEIIEPLPPGSVYGYHWMSRKHIVIYLPEGLPKWLLKIYIHLTRKHERGHAWGIVGCWKPWCLMFEAFEWKLEWKDVWWEKLAGGLMLFNCFRLCKQCRTTLLQLMKRKSQNEL